MSISRETNQSIMLQECYEFPKIILKQWKNNQLIIKELCQRLKNKPPKFAITVARGSSGSAAMFGKYLLETQLGLVCSCACPSVITLYEKKLSLDADSLVIAISQSGQSPDICETVKMARKTNAITIALVNDINSPLAKNSEYVIPLCAGVEKAVAATKTYLASLVALLQFITEYLDAPELNHASQLLPQYLTDYALKYSPKCAKQLADISYFDHALVLARGYGFPVALELALKLKEVTNIDAEALSGAEVLHGHVALLTKNYPVLLLLQQDETLASMLELAKRITQMDAKLILLAAENIITDYKLNQLANNGNASHLLTLPPSLHPLCDPIVTMQTIYPALAQLAIHLKMNPDNNPRLQKITRTI